MSAKESPSSSCRQLHGDAGRSGDEYSSSISSDHYYHTYKREFSDYQSHGKKAVQTIHVSEYGSDSLVKIHLFVNEAFVGTWIKTSQHFCNIIEWGNWRYCGRDPADVGSISKNRRKADVA